MVESYNIYRLYAKNHISEGLVMYQIDFNKPIHVYFCGIGGISMSGLAEILKSRDFAISGSDMKESEITEGLRAKGMTVYIGQHKRRRRYRPVRIYCCHSRGQSGVDRRYG